MKKKFEIKEVMIPTKYGKFLCLFESNYPEAGFTVTSPAVKGFVSYGRDLQKAKRSAKEGLEFHWESVVAETALRPRHSRQVSRVA